MDPSSLYVAPSASMDYVRAMQELRRSSASSRHRNRKRYGKAARLKAKADLRREVA